jgi:hypothetical protein
MRLKAVAPVAAAIGDGVTEVEEGSDSTVWAGVMDSSSPAPPHAATTRDAAMTAPMARTCHCRNLKTHSPESSFDGATAAASLKQLTGSYSSRRTNWRSVNLESRTSPW